MTEKSSKVRELLLAGAKYPEITRQTGAASSTIAYHAKKLGLGKYEFVRKVYDWPAVQTFYDDGNCISEVIEHFGMSWATLTEARQRGDVFTPKRAMPKQARERKLRLANEGKRKRIHYSDDFIFAANSVVAMSCVKRRYAELHQRSCSNADCFLFDMAEPEWAGKPIKLHLDHVNGIRNDHRLPNLRWLCPNCHSQTVTYCGRNKGINGAPGPDRTGDPDI